MDTQPYNGWPNAFTWHVYTHLSSYSETYDMARAIVAQAATSFAADEALRAWVEEMFSAWCETCTPVELQTLWTDLGQAALRQVVWQRVTQAFAESRW